MNKVFREVRKFGSNIFFDKRNLINYPAHIHEEIELVFVKKGRAIGFCDGKKYELTEGTFFLTFPNQVHYYSDDCEGEYIVLIVHPMVLHGFEKIFGDSMPVSATYFSKEGDSLVDLLELAYEDYIEYGNSPVISAYLAVIIGKLLRHYEIDKSYAPRNTVFKILQYCSTHYKEKITVGEVAQGLNISRSTVSHIFAEQLKINFCEYINSLRLGDAEQLLENRIYSMTEVAEMSGFSDARTFNRAFLKKNGMSPSAYRKKIIGQ